MSFVKYRHVTNADKENVCRIIKENWYSDLVVVHNSIYIPSNLPGFIAEENENIIGLITYYIEDNNCEIVTLDSMKENCGIGSALINKVKEEAKNSNCTILWLITTNDNLHAISFYVKRGFELTGINKGAVNESRKIKPEIPLLGFNNIPITDELKFTMNI
ncbi:MAG: GNAT family N-acetyltransferase [Flavobacterium sp.]|nr:GNAT family N-acetyltransferase [Flavobacterium sp.]